MKKLLVRLIPDHIYQALETAANRAERSMEGHARYVLTQSVENQRAISGGERYQSEISDRLNQVLPAVNKVRTGPALTPAKVAEQLGHHDAVATENWFTGNAVPGFSDLNNLSELFGCSARWLKFGEQAPFPMNSQARINWKGGNAADVDALLAPDSKGNPVSYIRIIRLSNDAGNILILREFKDTLTTDFFYTNLHLSEEIGNGGFHDLADFLVILQELYSRYIKGGFSVKSYNLRENDLTYHYREGHYHPLYLIKHGCQESVWWEDIWHAEMLERRGQKGGYFWEGDSALIDRLHRHLSEKKRLKSIDELEIEQLGLPD
ncbi:hypothetical protein [Serratia sp. 14-2641]|uniref:FitA-like ribbon-helix-helix domain-containing protein n=1 Tax=Serratia sp. 14-2641 TaxID=1841657 RepID=UPI00080F895C|nr:hypothetical protein [Serratia sp. 14-2641]OCJ36776.1 hypothetical protein A6U95_03735 [Serratia sp. 14-2641]